MGKRRTAEQIQNEKGDSVNYARCRPSPNSDNGRPGRLEPLSE